MGLSLCLAWERIFSAMGGDGGLLTRTMTRVVGIGLQRLETGEHHQAADGFFQVPAASANSLAKSPLPVLPARC